MASMRRREWRNHPLGGDDRAPERVVVVAMDRCGVRELPVGILPDREAYEAWLDGRDDAEHLRAIPMSREDALREVMENLWWGYRAASHAASVDGSCEVVHAYESSEQYLQHVRWARWLGMDI